MAAFNYSQVRKGMVIVGDDGQLYSVIDRDLNTPGNWRAILNLKLKNLKTGAVTPRRFKPEDKVEVAYLDKRPMQYLYQEGDGYVFMDKETFDQITLSKEWVGDQILYLKENDDAQVTFYEGKPLSLELPADGRVEGGRDRAVAQGRDGRGPVQAGHAGNGAEDHGAAVRRHRRNDSDRHAHRRVPQPGQVREKETETLVPSINYVELRRGMIIIEEGQLCQVMDRDLKTPGNLPSKLRIKLKNLKTGFVQRQARPPRGQGRDRPTSRRATMQYLYQDGDGYVFMDKENYDQITLGKEWVGDQMLYLKENEDAKVTFHEGKPLSLELPNTVELKVIGNRAGAQGRDGGGPVQAGHAGNRPQDHGAAVHQHRRGRPGRYAHRRVPEPGEMNHPRFTTKTQRTQRKHKGNKNQGSRQARPGTLPFLRVSLCSLCLCGESS